MKTVNGISESLLKKFGYENWTGYWSRNNYSPPYLVVYKLETRLYLDNESVVVPINNDESFVQWHVIFEKINTELEHKIVHKEVHEKDNNKLVNGLPALIEMLKLNQKFILDILGSSSKKKFKQ